MAKLAKLLLVAHAVVAQNKMTSCSPKFDNPQASFDLSRLYKEKGNYTADDVYRYSTDRRRPFSYFFNVCGEVDQPDESKVCIKDDGSNTAAAYQHVDATTNKSECFSLGRADSPVWEYVGGDNAGVGVRLTYLQGAPCRDAPGMNRSFAITFSCVHEESAALPRLVVAEEGFCVYKVTLETFWGCPMECHSGDHKTVCNGHGVCAVDLGTQRARCFCNNGKGGDTCDKDVEPDQPPSSSKINTILVTLVILLLLGLVALTVILYLRIKKLNTDDNPYSKFPGANPRSAEEEQTS